MKASLVLTFLVLAGAGLLGWHNQTRIESARATKHTLEQRATREAIAKPAANEHHDDRRPEVDGKALAAEVIAAGDKPLDHEKTGRELALLDEKGMQAFIDGIFAATPLDDKKRANLVMKLMGTALTDRPRASLSLFEKFRTAGGTVDYHEAATLVHGALEQLAIEDASSALEWLRDKGGKLPDIINEAARFKVLSTVAASDPQRAFREIGNLGIPHPQDAIGAIMRAGNTPAQRLAVIAALRGHLATLPDERKKKEQSDAALAHLAQSAVYGGDKVAKEWIVAAKFTPTEMQAFAKAISERSSDPKEIGGWVECLSSAGAEIFSGQPVQRMISHWTRNDYRAAGEWLLGTPDGPAKQAAVRAYAETVAHYEPEVAE
ncbi:MAG: hypothetical protein EOP88_09450, partial [Verrucomicrobiaceae bacterium]